jgi:microcystin-dependent protein
LDSQLIGYNIFRKLRSTNFLKIAIIKINSEKDKKTTTTLKYDFMKRLCTILLITLSFSLIQNVLAQDPIIGEIRMFAGDWTPQGWMKCEGQLLPINQNPALFTVIGTIYGGNGTTTFALPDLRGRVPIASGQGPGLSPVVVGEAFGTETTTLTVNQIPAHSHVLMANTGSGTTNVPTGNVLANTGSLDKEYATSANTPMGVTAIGPAGGSQPFSIVQPSLSVTFIIAIDGIYPQRDW